MSHASLAASRADLIIADLRRTQAKESDAEILELMDDLLQTLPDRVAALVEGYRRGDVDATARGAHQLAGTTGMFGFERLSEILRDIEHTFRMKGFGALSAVSFDVLEIVARRLQPSAVGQFA